MILEEETFKAYGYYSRDLKPHSHKRIIAVCDGCGKVRKTTKNIYHVLCGSCGQKGNTKRLGCKCTEEHKVKLRAANKGKKPSEETRAKLSMARKGHAVTEETKAKICVANKGKKRTEETKAKISAIHIGIHKGAKHPNWKGGEKLARARHHANRRELGYTLIMPLKKGEQGHHITNEYVIGIPAKVHQSMAGKTRKKHRTLVLQWLKVNDKKKYIKALCVLANMSNSDGL